MESQAMANMLFTSGGYYVKGGDRQAAVRMAISVARRYPLSFSRPSVAHKFLYCLLEGGAFYQRSRTIYRKGRTIFASSAKRQSEERF